MSIWTIKQAREWLESSRAEYQDDQKLRKLDYAVGRIVTFLEEEYLFPTTAPSQSQNQTPAARETSEPSSAPTTGPAVKRYGSAIANLDTRWGQYLLTVETGGSFKSISCTSDEWAAIRQFFLTPEQIRESLTTSGETRDGDRGPAAPESTEARGGKEAKCHGTGDERCVVAIAGGVPCADYVRCRIDPSTDTSSQEGA